MKRRIFCFLLAVMLAFMCFQSGISVRAEENDRLYLTVSEITLTLVGDHENIYIGTVPADEVSWWSENEKIITVENGVITAVKTGSTVIHAQYGDQHLTCKAGCLAKDLDSLYTTDLKLRQTPKRLPPKTDHDPVDFFSDAAIVGDSITMIFGQMEQQSNALGHPRFLARGGCSINGYVNYYHELFYRGKECHLEDVIHDTGVKKIFIMLGQNDLGYLSIEETLENYAVLIRRIREKSPDIIIFLQTCTFETTEAENGPHENEVLHAYNERLPEFAGENNCILVDTGIYAEDHFGALPPSYHYDLGMHLNMDGCNIWAQVLNFYAEMYENSQWRDMVS